MSILIKVKVKHGKGAIEENEGFIIVYTEEERRENKANYDVIKQISRHYNKDFRDIRIIKGKNSREKIIEIK